MAAALILTDSDDAGLVVVAKALLVASGSGGPGRGTFYSDSNRGGSDVPLDGELGIGADNTVISRFFRANADELVLNDDTTLDIGAYFGPGGVGNDLTLYFQTVLDGQISFSASGQYAFGGGGFARFTLPADAKTLLDNLADGHRFIFKLARLVTGTPLDGDAGALGWSAAFGTAIGAAAAPGFSGDAGALEWSAAFGTAIGAAGGPEFSGNAGALEWSAAFGTAIGATGAPGFNGDAGALEWSAAFDIATGTAGVPDFHSDAGALEWSAAFGAAIGATLDASGVTPMAAWFAELGTGADSIRFWSGDEDLIFDSKAYAGRNFIALSGSENSIGAPSRRMTASFAATTPELRAALLQDPGPLMVVIEWIVSNDYGQTWNRVPHKFVGKLSKPVIKDGIYSIEIETYGGDIDRGRPLKWSHDDQQKRFPGDRGMEYTRRLAEGIRDATWPP